MIKLKFNNLDRLQYEQYRTERKDMYTQLRVDIKKKSVNRMILILRHLFKNCKPPPPHSNLI